MHLEKPGKFLNPPLPRTWPFFDKNRNLLHANHNISFSQINKTHCIKYGISGATVVDKGAISEFISRLGSYSWGPNEPISLARLR